jgi:NAD(P) transhydrogenase subunit alpha
MGAVVSGFDIRPESREEIRSVGARSLDALAPEAVRRADVVIASASVPSRPAPVLVTAAMVDEMQPGSAIVDLAGGNCELTEHPRVTIVRDRNLSQSMPGPASRMLARNLTAFLELLVQNGDLSIPWEDELVRACSLTSTRSTRPG